MNVKIGKIGDCYMTVLLHVKENNQLLVKGNQFDDW